MREARIFLAAATLMGAGCHLLSGVTDRRFDDQDVTPLTEDGGGGTTSATGTSSAGGSDAQGGGAPAWMCGDAPATTASACPEECTGGCDEGTCVIDCNSSEACRDVTIDCPAGWPCTVECRADNACRGATVGCPDAHACEVECSCGWGTDCCADLTLGCSQRGNCYLDCSTLHPRSCDGAVVACGDGQCGADCPASDKPAVQCGNACQCGSCE